VLDRSYSFKRGKEGWQSNTYAHDFIARLTVLLPNTIVRCDHSIPMILI
jgi:hypothetical protein